DLAARVVEAAAVEPGLGFRLEHPVGARIADRKKVADRDVEPDPVVRPARLQHQHARLRIGAEPVRQHAAGRTRAHDDVVVIAVDRSRLFHCAPLLLRRRPAPIDNGMLMRRHPGCHPAGAEAAAWYFVWCRCGRISAVRAVEECRPGIPVAILGRAPMNVAAPMHIAALTAAGTALLRSTGIAKLDLRSVARRKRATRLGTALPA